MTTISELKQSIRREALQRRNSLDFETYVAHSKAIQELVQELDKVNKAKIIHIYSAMETRNEARIGGLIQTFLERNKTVVVPVMDFDDSRKLKHLQVTDKTQWKTNKWGVKEPVNGKEVDPAAVDLVIVPTVAADEKRNRIGYGKGYYDTFLAETKAFRIGVLFEINLYSNIPADIHDARLDLLVTERRVI